MGGDGQGEKHPDHRDRKSDGELMISLSEGTILLARHHLAGQGGVERDNEGGGVVANEWKPCLCGTCERVGSTESKGDVRAW